MAEYFTVHRINNPFLNYRLPMMMLSFRFLLLLVLLPALALAQLPEQLKRDFAPIDGIILMTMGDSYLVDLDANQGLRPGDILSVMEPGETIVHPQTRDIVGRIDQVVGYLEVTRVMSGYSYADLLTEGLALRSGDLVRRFEQVPAYIDPSVSESLQRRLRLGLDHLQWLDTPATEAGIGLYFGMQDERLSITDSGGALIGSYRYVDGQLLAPLAPGMRQTLPTPSREDRSLLNRGVDSLLGTVGIGRGDTRLETPGIARQQGTDSSWMSSPLNDNPVGLATGDLTGDGRTEIAVAMTNDIRIMRMEQGQFVAVAVVEFPAGTQMLTIDAQDMNQDGQAELYITAAIDTNLRSQVVEFRNDRFERVITMVDWFMRVVDLPGEGPVLLGQRMGSGQEPFRPPVFRIERSRDRLVRGDALDLPPRVNLFSMIPLTPAAEQLYVASISADDRLQLIAADNERLWHSDHHFGGSDASFYNQPDSNAGDRTLVTIQKRLLRLPSGEILTIQNQGSRLLQQLRTFTDTQLVAFAWDNSRLQLQERWRTPLQRGYMADVALADLDNNGEPELIVAMRFQEKNLLQRGHSALMVFKLQQ